jgi:hypothetical protein
VILFEKILITGRQNSSHLATAKINITVTDENDNSNEKNIF